MEAGRFAAGSSRALRLDPFSLPARFEAVDDAADGRVRVVDLYSRRVVVRRSVRGMRMAINVPVAAFRGVVHSSAGRAERAADGNCRCARTQRSGAVAAAVFVERKRRDRRRMAILGPRARPAASGRASATAACASHSRASVLCASRPPTWRRRRRSAIARRRPRYLVAASRRHVAADAGLASRASARSSPEIKYAAPRLGSERPSCAIACAARLRPSDQTRQRGIQQQAGK